MTHSSQALHVLLVEDDELVTQGLRSVLAASGAMRIVGSCASMREVSDWRRTETRLDVALVDLGLPDASGIDVLHDLSATYPEAALVAFTQYDDPDHVFAALQAGAVGYLLKSTPADRIVGLVEEAVAGGSPLSPSIARRIVGAFSSLDRQAVLTPRERSVLELLVQGASYAEVADAMDVQMSTVQTHVKSLYKKLRVSSRTAAEERARRLGLLPARKP